MDINIIFCLIFCIVDLNLYMCYHNFSSKYFLNEILLWMRVTWLKSQTVSQCTCECCFKTLEKVSPSFQLSVETRFPKKWAPRARLKNIDCLINNLSGRAGTLWLSQLSRWLKPACHQSVSEFDLIFFIFGSEGVRLAQRTWLISPLRPDDKSVIFMPRSFTSALQLHTLLKWLLSRGSGCLLLFFF